MPILDVEVVLRPGESLSNELAAYLANQAGKILNAPAGTVWVKVRALAAENYAENGGLPPEGIYPVFVTILKARLPEAEAMAAEAAELAAAIAQICARPVENIHIIYQPEGAG